MANSLVICAVLLLACRLSATIASSPTAPAFLWSDHRSVGLNTQGAVDYRVFSSQALVDTLLQKFDWSGLLCNINGGEKERLDALVAFIGKELHSEDIARDTNSDRLPVLRILKEYFTASSYSMALPYISVSTENGGVLNTLVSTIEDSCSLKTRPGKTLILGSCLGGKISAKRPYLTDGIELVDNVESLKDVILRRKASRTTSETDIILACSVSNIGNEGGESEEEMLATILSALRQSGTSNAVLYASDPVEATRIHGRYKGRMLASNTTSTTTTTCDTVCETVVGVYEGILVAVTLLIILISGLCCMMGIDTPSRFESAPDS